jgi:hypothetical protein
MEVHRVFPYLSIIFMKCKILYVVTVVRELIFINLNIAKKKNQGYRKSSETSSINYVLRKLMTAE